MDQPTEPVRQFRWWLIPSIIVGFIGSLSILSGSVIAFFIAYYSTKGDSDPDFLSMIATKGLAVVAAYLTLGGCLLVAAIKFWQKKLKAGLWLVAVGVLVMSVVVLFVS